MQVRVHAWVLLAPAHPVTATPYPLNLKPPCHVGSLETLAGGYGLSAPGGRIWGFHACGSLFEFRVVVSAIKSGSIFQYLGRTPAFGNAYLLIGVVCGFKVWVPLVSGIRA